MSRPNLSSPLSILLAGVLVIVLLLASTSASTRAVSSRLAAPATLTPCPDDDSDAALDCQDERSFMTADAEDALTAAAEAYPYDAPSVTSTTTQASVTATSGSPTTTTTTTGLPTGSSVAATTTRTPRPTNAPDNTIPTTEAGIASRAGTPPPTPTLEMNLNCVPGIPIMITGTGPAHAPLLLFFDQRPVGGGSATANGSFALKLVVGRERPGDYQVVVRVRGTSRVVRELTCTVPSIPTPIPNGR